MENKFTDKGEAALTNALQISESYGHTYIGSEHLLCALTCDKSSCAFALMKKCGVTKANIDIEISKYAGKGDSTVLSPADMTPRCRKILENAYKTSKRYGSDKIGTEHILSALLDQKDSVAYKILQLCGIDIGILKDETLTFLRATDKLKEKKSSVLPYLNQYGKNLTKLAAEGKISAAVGRERETERMIRILTRKTKNNPCLVGDAGVGKTAIVEGLAYAIANSTVPKSLIGKEIYSVDLTSMVAGAKYRGDFEERIKALIAEAAKNDHIIIFIDEIHTIVGAGAAEGAIDAANILKPELSRSNIHLIGATTFTEYRKYIERDPALERRFQPLYINEMTNTETKRVLLYTRKDYEKHHVVHICDAAIDAAIELSERYLDERKLPDKALDLIDEACAMVNVKNNLFSQKDDIIIRQNCAVDCNSDVLPIHSGNAIRVSPMDDHAIAKVPTVTEGDVQRIVAEITGIPQNELMRTVSYEEIVSFLKERIKGQPEAIAEVAAAVLRSRIGLHDPEKPRATFLFTGGTGVGKTELAKALSSMLFPGKDAFIRIDMSEFEEGHTISKLIGSPPGYVGYDDGGSLTEQIRRHPYSLVLFDELEKASAAVRNLLLQILDEGHLTDSHSRRVSFKNAFIIMTSNLGADVKENSIIGFNNNANTDEGLNALLKRELTAEFLNRIDVVINFADLTTSALAEIANIELNSLKDKIEKMGIELRFNGELSSHIAQSCKKMKLGARPIKRFISSKIESPISRLLSNAEKAVREIEIKLFEEKIEFEIKFSETATI